MLAPSQSRDKALQEIRNAIEQAGAELHYLPPYSPELNPIEMAFAKLKAILKKAAARTVDDLWRAIAKALPMLTAEECGNYLAAPPDTMPHDWDLLQSTRRRYASPPA